MTNISVSIIIPVYNVEQFISECINSVFSQTAPENIECIIIDDCGNDSSMSIVEDMIAEYSGPIVFSIIHHKNNKGLSGARNTGIQAAKGEYLFFLDSDDAIIPECIATLTKPLYEKKYDVVSGDFRVVGGEDVFIHLSMTEGAYIGKESIAEAKRLHRWYPMAWGKLYKTEFIKKHNLLFREGIIHEDELFSCQIGCVAESMYCMPELKSYIYRVRPCSIMTSVRYEKEFDSVRIILSEMYSFLERNNLKYDPLSNDLLYFLFSFANEVSWKYSKEEFNHKYPIFRRIVSPHYGERLIADKRFKAIIRDLHFLLPPIIGKYVYAALLFKGREFEMKDFAEQ